MEEKSLDKDKWGWVVCFGTVITFIAGIGHVNSFGLIYNDFMIETDSSAKSLTSAHGVFAIMLAIGGIILNILSKIFPLRLGGFVGAFLLILGSFFTIFISSTNQLPITFGILQGIGFGMMVPVCYSTINRYYVKRRTAVMSICKAVQGLILILYPQMIKKILSFYGFRGTLLIISGISLHTLPGMAVMTVKDENSPKWIKTANVTGNRATEPENNDLLNHKTNDDVLNVNDNLTHRRKSRNKLSLELLDILNITVLRNVVYCNICIVVQRTRLVRAIVRGVMWVALPKCLQTALLVRERYPPPACRGRARWTTAQVATCISTCAGADVAGRCALAFISSFFNVNTRVLFYFSTFFTLIIRLVILQVRQFVWVLVLTGALGVLRAWLHVASPLVISSHVSHQEFPGAYALFMLVTGIVNLTFAPVVGLLKDIYQDYVPAFYLLTLCCFPCLILWPMEYMLLKKK